MHTGEELTDAEWQMLLRRCPSRSAATARRGLSNELALVREEAIRRRASQPGIGVAGECRLANGFAKP